MTGPVDASVSTGNDPTWWDELQTIPQLKQAVLQAQITDTAGSVFLAHALRSIRHQATPTLLMRVSTVDHPMTAWALQVELNARNVPPCLRPWMPARSLQSEFLATLVDLHWLATRHPEHPTKHQRLSGVFRYPVQDDRWHRVSLWAYRQCRGQRHALAARLALTDAMRCQTRTMPSRHQSGDRRMLGKQLSTMKDALYRHALAHPDKSGATTAEAVAERRARLVHSFVTMGRNQIDTVTALRVIDGTSMSRQTLVRQLRAAQAIADDKGLIFGSL